MIYVTLKHPVNIVDLGYASTPAQAAEYTALGYLLLEEWRAYPDLIRHMNSVIADMQATILEQQRRLDDQANLIKSLRRQTGE